MAEWAPAALALSRLQLGANDQYRGRSPECAGPPQLIHARSIESRVDALASPRVDPLHRGRTGQRRHVDPDVALDAGAAVERPPRTAAIGRRDIERVEAA